MLVQDESRGMRSAFRKANDKNKACWSLVSAFMKIKNNV